MKFLPSIVLLALSASISFARVNEEFQKTYNKSFPTKPGVVLEIENKYGKVHVNTWDKDSVRVHIDFIAKSKNEDKLAKLVASVKFDFDNSSDYITAKTTFLSSTSLSSDIRKILDAVSADNVVIIDYRVHCPAYAKLIVDNKYGDVYLDDRTTETEINLVHGDLKSTNFSKDLKLDLSFGKATIRKMTTGKFDLAYCTRVKIDEADKVDLDSKYSEYEIGKINSLMIDSRRDDITIEEINSLRADALQTKFYLEDLSSEINLETRFGHLIIENLSADFQKCRIESKYTDIDIRLASETNCGFDLRHRNVDLRYPQETKISTTDILENDKKPLINTKGSLGSGASNTIRITAESADVTISKQ